MDAMDIEENQVDRIEIDGLDGFIYASDAEGRLALKEAEGVQHIRQKVDMDSPEVVLRIYNRMIQKNMFETMPGLLYLKELREYLLSIPFIDGADVQPIPVRHTALEEEYKKEYGGSKRQDRARRPAPAPQGAAGPDYRPRFRVACAVAAFLAVCVVAMFALTLTSDSPNIINYESRLVDRYEAWESELEEREALLEEREAEAGL